MTCIRCIVLVFPVKAARRKTTVADSISLEELAVRPNFSRLVDNATVLALRLNLFSLVKYETLGSSMHAAAASISRDWNNSSFMTHSGKIFGAFRALGLRPNETGLWSERAGGRSSTQQKLSIHNKQLGYVRIDPVQAR